MKRITLVISFLVLFCTLGAQDTIYPFAENYPFFKDTAYRVMDTGEWRLYYYFSSAIRAVEHKNVQAVVTGLAIPYRFGTRSTIAINRPDTISVRGAIIQIVDSDYSNPIIHFTNPVVWNYNETPPVRPYDCYLAYRSSTECGDMDTVLEAYSLYFNYPIVVSGNVFVGYIRNIGDHTTLSNDGEGAFFPSRFNMHEECYSQYPYPAGLEYWYNENGTFDCLGDGPNYDIFGFSPATIICPIFSSLDTDSFSCPEVEGLAFAGMNAGDPTLMWDTASEHDLYQLAYGPYDAPIDSLRVVETRERFAELFDRTLSDDIYYQARLRARCHHRCPVHDTVMWTEWSEPVFFYTGDSMPDTTHQQPIGIAPVSARMAFVLAPNPTHGSVTLTLEEMPVAGTTLVMHDGAGREVLYKVLHERVTIIETDKLSAGVYTVTVSNPRGSATRRLSVE